MFGYQDDLKEKCSDSQRCRYRHVLEFHKVILPYAVYVKKNHNIFITLYGDKIYMIFKVWWDIQLCGDHFCWIINLQIYILYWLLQHRYGFKHKKKCVSCKATYYNFHVIVISIYTHEKSYDFHKRRHTKKKSLACEKRSRHLELQNLNLAILSDTV